MGEISKIEWTDATWNVAVGCTKVSEGCKYCYMMRDYEGRFGRKDVNGTVTRTKDGTFKAPLKWQKQGLKCVDGSPLKVFTSSLTDVFHEQIDPYRDEVWEIIRQCPDLIFQILTKRPERIKDCLPEDWGAGYPNVWLGVSVESSVYLNRIRDLSCVPAKTKFVSFEPLVGWMVDVELYVVAPHFDWAIIGGESGNDQGKYGYRKTDLRDIHEIMEVCIMEEIPVFVKQLGTHLAKEMGMKDRHGRDMGEWPEWLRVREFPHTPSNPLRPADDLRSQPSGVSPSVAPRGGLVES